jgi:hypothetical protein
VLLSGLRKEPFSFLPNFGSPKFFQIGKNLPIRKHRAGGASMEKKENKTRLRLVKTDTSPVDEKTKQDEPNSVQLHSRFAQQMNGFADDLDRMIEAILRS